MKGAVAFLLVVLLLGGMAYVIFAYQTTGEVPHIPYINPESDVPANQPTTETDTETTGGSGAIEWFPGNEGQGWGVITKEDKGDAYEYTNIFGTTWQVKKDTAPETMTNGGTDSSSSGSENTWYPPNIPQTPQPVNIYNTDWIRNWLNSLRAP